MKSLRAGISMEKYNSQLGVEDKYNGVVIYLPGSRSAMRRSDRLEQPATRNHGSKQQNTRSSVRAEVAYSGRWRNGGKDNNAGRLLEMMNMSRQQLEARFQPVKDVREETLWGGVSTIHLTLVPKGNAGYKYAEVWIDSAGMPGADQDR